MSTVQFVPEQSRLSTAAHAMSRAARLGTIARGFCQGQVPSDLQRIIKDPRFRISPLYLSRQLSRMAQDKTPRQVAYELVGPKFVRSRDAIVKKDPLIATSVIYLELQRYGAGHKLRGLEGRIDFGLDPAGILAVSGTRKKLAAIASALR